MMFVFTALWSKVNFTLLLLDDGNEKGEVFLDHSVLDNKYRMIQKWTVLITFTGNFRKWSVEQKS